MCQMMHNSSGLSQICLKGINTASSGHTANIANTNVIKKTAAAEVAAVVRYFRVFVTCSWRVRGGLSDS